MEDLPALNLDGISDKYRRFEASLPFARTLVVSMIQKIEEAHKSCGETGYVTLAALAEALPTSAWAPLKDPSSQLANILLDDAFKNPEKNQAADQIDVEILTLVALLHCSGKPIDKTRAFYCILQEGGFEAHDMISAQDKDFAPVFEKLIRLSTADVFSLAEKTGNVPRIYEEDEVKLLVSEDLIEGLREDHFLEEVYGAQSRLQNDVWVEKVSKVANWVFDACELRKKVFDSASIPMRH